MNCIINNVLYFPIKYSGLAIYMILLLIAVENDVDKARSEETSGKTN